MPSEQGDCKAQKKRFFYNAETGDCEHFVYGGCPGNGNRFISLDACRRVCKQQVSTTASAPVLRTTGTTYLYKDMVFERR